MDRPEPAQPDAAPDGEASPPMQTGETRTSRPRLWLSRFGLIGLGLLVIGGLGLWSDYTLSWFASTTERSVPVVGLVNEGAPWVPQDRGMVESAYADAPFYSQGFLLWPFVAWAASLVAGVGLVASDALRRWPRVQANLRTILLTGHILAAGMMLLTVSRRFGRQFIDIHYNGIHFYRWEDASWVQAGAAPLLVLAAGYLLWHLRRTHPRIGVPGLHKPHHASFRLATGTIGIVALALLLSPWLPLAEVERPAIIGNLWLAEGTMHSYANRDLGAQTLAGLGYVGATRALFVAAGTALITTFGIVGWERTRSHTRARIWGLVAQVHLIAIVPLHLGMNGYGIYVQYAPADTDTTLAANQFIGQALDILLVTWIAHVMWILLPYLKRWPRAAPPGDAPAHEEKETGREGGGHALPSETS